MLLLSAPFETSHQASLSKAILTLRAVKRKTKRRFNDSLSRVAYASSSLFHFHYFRSQSFQPSFEILIASFNVFDTFYLTFTLRHQGCKNQGGTCPDISYF